MNRRSGAAPLVHPDWLLPDWPAPPQVRALCTTRAGGCSRPPYNSFNLGDHVGDAPQDVAANRVALTRALGARPVFLRQVHGTTVARLDAGTPEDTAADGCVSTRRGVACAILAADCLPVLFTDLAGTAVAAAHAGWRGLAGVGAGTGGVLDTVHEQFCLQVKEKQPRNAIETIAWLGPCIGPRAFEVGPEVKAAFEAQDTRATTLLRPHGHGRWLADLQGLARLRLQALGVSRIYGNDGSPGWCTVGNPSRFFSHRRDRVSGRLAACIGLA